MTIIGSILLAIISMQSSFAQEAEENIDDRDYKVRPVRLGLKLGFPNIIGGNLEYVTPLLNDRLSVSVDYSTLKSDWFLSSEDNDDNTDIQLSYLEGGFNYYFFKAGKGLYGGLNYGKFKFEGQTSVEKEGKDGTGEIDYTHNSISIKLGAKIGGLFYLRPEIGYAFASLPETVDYTANYEDGTSERETYDLVEELAVPDIFFKGFMANIGIGFAF